MGMGTTATPSHWLSGEKKRRDRKMLILSLTWAEQWVGNGSHTMAESQPDHPSPASVTECLSTGGSPEVGPATGPMC